MNNNILLIASSRDFNNYDLLCYYMSLILKNNKIDKIMSGGARGADSLAQRYADEHNIPFQLFPANWDLHGKSAGYIRNVEMGKCCKAGLIFWDGQSRGTNHMINILNQQKKKYIICHFNK